jgi:hypothetical protein
MTARRLGRAGFPLAVLALTAAAGVVLDPSPHWLAVLGGAPVAALALLALGMRGVARAYGAREGGWSAVPAALWVVPWGYGVYVLGWPGLLALRDAVAGGGRSGGLAVVTALLGLQVLRTSAKVGEVARLGGVMGGGSGAEAGTP